MANSQSFLKVTVQYGRASSYLQSYNLKLTQIQVLHSHLQQSLKQLPALYSQPSSYSSSHRNTKTFQR